jgi:hypothetical protein
MDIVRDSFYNQASGFTHMNGEMKLIQNYKLWILKALGPIWSFWPIRLLEFIGPLTFA